MSAVRHALDAYARTGLPISRGAPAGATAAAAAANAKNKAKKPSEEAAVVTISTMARDLLAKAHEGELDAHAAASSSSTAQKSSSLLDWMV